MPLPNEPVARFCARLRNNTKRPSLLMMGEHEAALPGPEPSMFTLTSVVVPVCRFRSNTSTDLFASPGTKLAAELENTTNCPLLLMEASEETPAAGKPLVSALTRMFVPIFRSRTNTSRKPFVSLATRLSASLAKATYWPFRLTGTVDERLLGPSGDWDEIAGF